MVKKELEEQILSLFNNPSSKIEGFNLLVSTFKEPIYFQIRRILISHENTDDVLQEVFIKSWTKLHTFKKEAKLSTWLYRIAYNESLLWIRKHKKEHELEFESISSLNEPHTNIFSKDANQISVLLEKAIIKLPNKQKMVFQLKYFEDFSYKEIQKITGGSIGGLKATYFHAVKKIKEFLSQY
jgi:RNA polymerase sigma-70 factor (ECF subfamily)